MILGVDYYPELWGESYWEKDADLMLQAGIRLIRIGRFAWSVVEPKRQDYQLDWLQQAINYFHSRGIDAVLCTPTAVPPIWLVKRHPSLLGQNANGALRSVGGVHFACVNNEPYRKYVRYILRQMAVEFRRCSGIAAWQIDAEIGGFGTGRCHCDSCVQAFREWLRARYGSIGRLNQIWGGLAFGYRFEEWLQIPGPRDTSGSHLPALHLDYSRFCSASWEAFVQEQTATLRQWHPRSRMIVEADTECPHIDVARLGEGMDAVAAMTPPRAEEDWRRLSLAIATARSAGRGNFWLTGMRSGCEWRDGFSALPDPERLKLQLLQAVAHGVDGIILNRWRPMQAGLNAGLDGCLGSDGLPTLIHKALCEFSDQVRDNGDCWQSMGGRRRKAALVRSSENEWAHEHPCIGAGYDYSAHARAIHDSLRSAGCDVDIVPPGVGLGGYGLAVVPAAIIHRDAFLQDLRAFARTGGRLLITFLHGARDSYNGATQPLEQPELRELAGVSILRSGPAPVEYPGRVTFTAGPDGDFRCGAWAERLRCEGATAVAVFRGGALDGSPALTRHVADKGVCYYLAAHCEQKFYADFLAGALSEMSVPDVRWTGRDLEVVCGSGERGPWVFALNHGTEDAELNAPGNYSDPAGGETAGGAKVAPGSMRFLEGRIEQA